MNHCPVCGGPMEGHIQRGFGFGPDRWEEHCVRRTCKLYMVTLTEGEHANLVDLPPKRRNGGEFMLNWAVNLKRNAPVLLGVGIALGFAVGVAVGVGRTTADSSDDAPMSPGEREALKEAVRNMSKELTQRERETLLSERH